MRFIRKRHIVFFLTSLGLHYIAFTLLPGFYFLLPSERSEIDDMLYVEVISQEPEKITFTNQKVNFEKPAKAEFLAEYDNTTEEQVKNLEKQKPVDLRTPELSAEIQFPDEGDIELRSSLRSEQVEYPSLEEYLEDFRDEDDIREDDYVSINTISYKFISYFKRLKQKIEFVMNLPQEAVALGINGHGIIGFTISRDGDLLGAEILGTTGHRILDEEMILTLRKAAPFEPLPKIMDREYLRIKGVFSFRVHYSYQ